MGLTFNGPFREVVGLQSKNIVTIVLRGQSFWTQIKPSIQGSGRSVEVVGQRGFTAHIYIYIGAQPIYIGRAYIYIYIHTHIYMCVYVCCIIHYVNIKKDTIFFCYMYVCIVMLRPSSLHTFYQFLIWPLAPPVSSFYPLQACCVQYISYPDPREWSIYILYINHCIYI